MLRRRRCAPRSSAVRSRWPTSIEAVGASLDVEAPARPVRAARTSTSIGSRSTPGPRRRSSSRRRLATRQPRAAAQRRHPAAARRGHVDRGHRPERRERSADARRLQLHHTCRVADRGARSRGSNVFAMPIDHGIELDEDTDMAHIVTVHDALARPCPMSPFATPRVARSPATIARASRRRSTQRRPATSR